MKKRNLLCVAVIFSLGLFQAAVFGQGSLTPPGAPGATMKSLDQVEPRTLINTNTCPGDSGNSFIISQPGSYYLTTNMVGTTGKSGISIAADNVTINLNGFTLSGVAGARLGITTSGNHRGARILNGCLTDWPAGGIVIVGAGASASDITVLNSGRAIVLDQQAATLITHCIGRDINVGVFTDACFVADNVESCSLHNISGGATVTGISGYVRVNGCQVQAITGTTVTAISSSGVVSDCTVFNLFGTTILGIVSSSVSHCVLSAVGNSSTTSIVGINGSWISDCKVSGISQAAASSTASSGISGFSVLDCQVFNMTYSSSAFGWGIKSSQLVKGCSVVNLHNSGTGGGAGIGLNFFSNSSGLVSESRVDGCVIGIVTVNGCQVINCVAVGCDGNGIQTGQRCRVVDCTAGSNGILSSGAGIVVDIRSQVVHCNVNDNTGDGIAINGGCRVENCSSENNGSGSGAGAVGSGIRVVAGSGSRIESNHVRDNHRYGVEAGAGDVIMRNSSGNNGLGQYLPSSGANFGPVQTPSAATNPAANF
ncbi:MAG: hypothetical protein JWM68_1116 [Verrucomicrobiales bacterium]|nr:hypothetical protein [Verrucomicrobiales bacterium]